MITFNLDLLTDTINATDIYIYCTSYLYVVGNEMIELQVDIKAYIQEEYLNFSIQSRFF